MLFTKTEEKLIKHFVLEFGAKIYWDIDTYYLEDKNQEAGLFFQGISTRPCFLDLHFPKKYQNKLQTEKAKNPNLCNATQNQSGQSGRLFIGEG
jgi:hypothetical protein